MQYDAYREKMKRVAGILGKIYARRFIILVALVAVILTASVMVMTRGLLVMESDCPAETTYGDKFPFRAGFVLSKTHYEHKDAGGDGWVEGKPVFPGTYSVRAWGKTSFGERNYTDTYEITVLPRDLTLTITNTNPVYGELPLVKAVGLAKGDQATCDVVLADRGAATTAAYPNLSTLRITDKKGGDRLSCYTVASPEGVTVSFRPRSLTVTVQNASKTFDDTALSYDGYEITSGTLLNGDNLVAVFRDTLIDAGTKTNTPELRIYNSGGIDVTDLYSITVKSGKLTVEKRPLIVQAGSSSFTYAGYPLDYHQYFVDQSTPLVSGHRLEVQTASTILDVGTAPNILTFTVLNRRGMEETHNYSVFVKEGTLTVTPRAVTIHTESGSLIYNGEDQSYPYVTVENGVGDEYRAVGATTRRDVGTSTNHLQVEFWRDGKNITSNYNITGYTFGTLEITPRPLSVKLDNSEKIYDGTPLKAGNFTVNPSPYTLPKGHTLTLQAKGEVTFGSAPHTYVQNSARVTDGEGKDVTQNYDISVTDGTLTVNPRPLTVSSNGNVRVYDGKPLFQNAWTIASGSLLPTHNLSATLSGVSIIDAGTAVNTFDREKTRIFDKYTKEDVSQYYDVTYSEGILEIQPRPITVTTSSGEWMYDAAEHRGDTAFEITAGNLLAGHTAEIASADGVILNAGTVKNRVTLRIMNDEWEVTHNYKITYDYGDLTVTKRPITVRVQSITLTYDGAAHTSVDVILAPDSPYPLATPRHALRVRDTDAPVFTDAGSYINDPVISVYDSRAGVFVTENYEITRYEGTVTIEKRPLHVQLNGEKMYDGKPMGESDYRIAFINGTSPAVGHTVNAQPTEIHYGSAYTMKSSIEQSTLTIRDGYGRNVRKNYDVHFYEGSLTVTRRPISLVTASAEKIYDGTPLVAYDVILSPESLPLVNGDEALMVVSGSQTEVGQSPNTAHPETFVICDVLGQDVTENYELISVTEGTLTVKYDTVVTVITAGAQKLYDGRPLTCPEYETVMDGEPLPEGYRLSVTVTGSRLGVGKSPNTAEVAIYDDQGLDVTHLFTVQIRPGILTVLEDRDSVFGRVFSRKSGLVYLRNASYGGYTGQGWSAAIPYAETLSGGYSLNLLPAAALSYLGLVESTTLTFADMGVFLLPYYAEIGGGNPVVGSDTDYSGMELSDYTVSFYMVADTLTLLSGYNQVPSAVRPYLLGQYASAERAYRQFVHANYLEMDSETRAFMDSVIALQGFDPADPNVVEAVARYIRAAAVYSLDYDTALDTEDNMAVAFLRDYREGVCVHYATAATLLYRALGIPARYVTGFALEVTANGWTEIRNPGHAWVEVYVDGLGWIPVEVTGSAAEPSPPSDEDPKPTETLELEPVFRYKVYDGDYLYPLNQLEMTPSLKKYLDLGYTYEVEIMGNRREVGDGESYVSYFILYDPTGRDVTDQFILEKKTGVLRVVEADIRVSLYPVEKTYDGTYTRWGEGDYLVFSLPEGCTLELTVLLRDEDFPRGISVSGLNTRRDHVATYRVLRGGEDVTHNYELIFVSEWNLENGGEPPLRILPRVLELTAASETRVDNGTPLENHTVYLTKGTLAPGHKLVTSVSGCLTAVGEAENVISSVRVLDDRGRDVTFLYSITTVSGRLVLVEDTDRST